MTNTEKKLEEPVLPSKPLSPEDLYYYERGYKEPIESMVRIEETAKILIGATTTVSGLLLAAFKLAAGETTVPLLAIAPTFLCWAASIVLLVLVLLPEEYQSGKDEPEAVKRAFRSARDRKFKRLLWGAMLFLLGMLYAAIPFLALLK